MGHNDRISVNSKKNLKNTIFAFEKRLKDFEEDFNNHPKQKANLLTQIGTTFFRIKQRRKGLFYFRQMLKCNCDFIYKVKMLLQLIKAILRARIYLS